MFEKYFVINEAKIICGQTSQGTWYCKELPANTTQEADVLINRMNTILNKYNKAQKTETVEEKRKR